MKLLPGVELTRKRALKHFRWLAVNENGTARVFEDRPVKAGNTWVPDEFSSTCYRVEGNFEDKSGELLKIDDPES